MASVYILFSVSRNRYYVGLTTESASSRLQKHNEKFYGKHFTSMSKDWELKLEILCKDHSQGRRVELYIKRMKSRLFIMKLIASDEEVQRLKERCKPADSSD